MSRSSFVGHTHERELLQRAVASGRVPHALLFSGPNAVGKKLTALELIAQLLVRHSQLPADENKNLLWAGNHPDVLLIEALPDKRDISVEQVRSACEHLNLKSYYGGAKIALINDAHRLSIAAANALLMTLEEPSADSFLFLISHAPHRLPPTILSRCQRIYFGQLTADESEKILDNISSTLKLSEKVKSSLRPLCEGSFSELFLAQQTHPVSGTFLQPEQTRETLENLASTVASDLRMLNSFIESGTTSRALECALWVASDKELLDSRLTLLRSALRKKLRTARGSDLERFAERFTHYLKTEKGVQERNWSGDLQLSTTLTALLAS